MLKRMFIASLVALGLFGAVQTLTPETGCAPKESGGGEAQGCESGGGELRADWRTSMVADSGGW